MNEELQNALIGMLGTISQAKDYAMSEAPDVIRQFLQYHLIKVSILFVLFFIVGVLNTWFIKYIFSIKPESKSGKDNWAWQSWEHSSTVEFQEGAGALFFVNAGCLLASIAIIFMQGLTLLQILIAPKVYLLEYVASLTAK